MIIKRISINNNSVMLYKAITAKKTRPWWGVATFDEHNKPVTLYSFGGIESLDRAEQVYNLVVGLVYSEVA